MENPVRATTLEVIKKAKDVKINRVRIGELAKEWAESRLTVPPWPKEYHLKTDNDEALLSYIVLLSSINFCFWSQGKRWNIEYGGKTYNGYFGLSLALKKFFEDNREKGNLEFFSKISFQDFKNILRGGENLSFLEKRWKIVRAVSDKIIRKYGNSVNFFLSADKKVAVLVKKIYEELPSFNDISVYNGKKVYLLKRPQILLADAWGSFDGKGITEFEDMDYLTCFPDYKVPQALNYLGILEYSEHFNRKIKNRILIPHNSKQEVEIRSATVWGVEYLKEELEKEGKSFYAFEVDWILWNKAQQNKIEKPYHLTKTIFY
ncbi:queuosine salvage family protein [Patescibacteria group bacterium]|nr:queuosine salvage family protein [Patescibacteria group bacterium]